MISDLSISDCNTIKRFNSPLFPTSIRGCIIGKSGCGKTNLLMNLLLNNFSNYDYLDYDHLYIYGKSLHQPEYKLLNNCLKLNNSKSEIFNCFKNKIDPTRKLQNNTIEYFQSEEISEIPDPTEFNLKHKNLIIFDDVMLENQSIIESFYTRGRHNNIDCIYISQNYFKLPRQTIRENSNLLFIFQQDNKNINHIYNDHCSDLDLPNFKLLCKNAWSEKYGFITIDLSKTLIDGKYRKGLNCFFFPNEII